MHIEIISYLIGKIFDKFIELIWNNLLALRIIACVAFAFIGYVFYQGKKIKELKKIIEYLTPLDKTKKELLEDEVLLYIAAQKDSFNDGLENEYGIKKKNEYLQKWCDDVWNYVTDKITRDQVSTREVFESIINEIEPKTYFEFTGRDQYLDLSKHKIFTIRGKEYVEDIKKGPLVHNK